MECPLHLNDHPIVFLGGIFTPAQTDLIQDQSKGVVQNAADALQKGLIGGISAHRPSATVVNLPFVGSYPQLFRRWHFPGTDETIGSGTQIWGESFVLIKGVKTISRLLSATRGLFRHGQPNMVILIYSAHLPFMVAALARKLFGRGVKIVQVLPDFPEFMGEGGMLYDIAKAVETRLFYRLSRHIDGFVLLTRFMADRLGIDGSRYVVVEGIAQAPEAAPRSDAGAIAVEPGTRAFLYTGTLAARYGVMDLVDAFRRVGDPSIRLWVCGEGDSRDRIVAAAQNDPRIRYFGQVSRHQARRLQELASVLVNPRTPEGEFTKYSFPSKTLEYMASGRPVLMHRLSGIPEEYEPYYFKPESTDVAGLTDAIQALVLLDDAVLRERGAAARDFVLNEKSAISQCKKIVEFIDSL
ncbi:hypothetical protein ASC89_12795 [Devosia sp. Root413D1]|nr:hypothetical protein ASC89_12795 [Devosia sp. Root413D1]